MKRWTFPIVLCMFLGVVTTVGVAWGLEARGLHDGPEMDRGDGIGMRRYIGIWNDDRPEFITAMGPKIWFWGYYYENDFGFQRISLSAGIPVAVENHHCILDLAGWPLPALRATEWLRSINSRTVQRKRSDSIPAPLSIRLIGQDELPIRPIFPGFLIDTLFYAVIWFGIFFGPGPARRSIRRRRGRCVKCGYDLRGSPDAGCPECGWGRAA